MKRSLLAIALLVGAAFLGTGAQMASAQGDPYATTSVVTVPTLTVVRGARLWVTGAGCAPHVKVTLRLDDGTALGTTRSDDRGAFRIRVHILRRVTLGAHVITGQCAAPMVAVPAGRSASRSAAGSTASSAAGSGTGAAASTEDAAMVASAPVNGQVTQTLHLSVVSGSSGSGLARTGTSVTLPLLAVAAAALTLGGAFLIGSRRTGDA